MSAAETQGSAVAADAAMTEREKMLAGLPYLAMLDQSLVVGRLRAKRLTAKYNALPHAELDNPGDGLTEAHKEVLAELFDIPIERARLLYLEPPLYVDYGTNTRFLENTVNPEDSWSYANYGLTLLDCARVSIGVRTILAPHVQIYAATHSTQDVESRRNTVEYAFDVVIGNDVWLGGGVKIVGPAIIGDGCTIAAGSVVTKDCEPFCVYGGVPAKLLKRVPPIPPRPGDPMTPGVTARKPDHV